MTGPAASEPTTTGPAPAEDVVTGPPAGPPTGPGPLAGVRVIELAGLGPAPLAGMILADLGADVVLVDRAHPAADPPPSRNVTARGKRFIRLDLKSEAGRESLGQLVERADILIEGFRPGVLERLGFGPEDVWPRNPGLVIGRMTGWGQDGPWARSAGHDLNYVAVTGALAAIGAVDGAPQLPLNLVGDFGGGTMFLVVGVLAALVEARRSGRGQVVDAAIIDGVSVLAAQVWGEKAAGTWDDRRGTNRLDGAWPFYRVYETADGEWFSVGALEPQFFADLVGRLGLPEWAGRQHERPAWPEMQAAFAAAFATRTRAEWATIFAGTDACAAPVLRWDEALDHPHLAGRGTLVEVEGIPQPAPAPRFSRSGTRAPRAPQPGLDQLEAVRSEWAAARAPRPSA